MKKEAMKATRIEFVGKPEKYDVIHILEEPFRAKSKGTESKLEFTTKNYP
jgi:hypothetical protein